TMTPLVFMPMAVLLLAPDAKRITSFFLGRRAEPTPVAYLEQPRWFRAIGSLVKAATFVWLMTGSNHFYFSIYHDTASTLGGLYRVDRFVRNGVDEPLAYEYPRRWQDVAIGRLGEEIVVRTVDDTRISYHTGADAEPWSSRDTNPLIPVLEQARQASLP